MATFDVQGFTAAAKQRGYSQPQIDSYVQSKGLAPAPKSVGGFVGNVFGSAANLVGGVASAVFHPIKTVGALGAIAGGGISKLIPGEQGNEKSFDALTSFFKERYGSVEALGETLYSDPVGALADLSAVAGGAGIVAKGLSFAAKADVARLALQAARTGKRTLAGDIAGRNAASRAATTLQTVSKATNPLGVIGTAGKITEKATAGRSIAPFAKSFKPGTAAVAEELGVKLPASALSKSTAVGTIESLAGRGFFGHKLANLVEEAGNKLNLIAETTIQKIGATTNLSEVGKLITTGLENFRTAWRIKKDALYEQTKIGGVKIEVQAPKTVAIIDEVIRGKQSAGKVLGGDVANTKFFENLRNGLTGSENSSFGRVNLGTKINADEVRAALREINLMIKNFNDPVSTGNQAVLKRIAASLEAELDDAIRAANPKLGKAIDEANAYYQQGVDKLNSSYGNKITEFADQPDVIAKSIITGATSVEDIPKIYEVIGEEARKAVQASFLETFFQAGRSKVTGVFTQGGLSTQIQKFGRDKLQAILSPEQYNVVLDLEKLSKALGRGQKVAEGSQTFFIGRLAAEMTAILFNPLLGLKMAMGDMLFSKFITSKIGQDLLTGGVPLTGSTGRGIQRAGAVVSPLLPVERLNESQVP